MTCRIDATTSTDILSKRTGDRYVGILADLLQSVLYEAEQPAVSRNALMLSTYKFFAVLDHVLYLSLIHI